MSVSRQFLERAAAETGFQLVAVDREGMLADRPKVEAAVTELARSSGYTVQRSADAHAGRKMYLA